MVIPITLFALTLVAGFGPGVPRVSPATTIDPAIDRADGAFLDGDYQHALENYLQLYTRTREPNYLHNIASCYEKLGSLEQAIEYFTRYLEVGKELGAGARAEVRRKLEQLQAEQLQAALRQRRGEGAAAASPPAALSPAPLLPPPAPAPPAFGTPVAPPPAPSADWPAGAAVAPPAAGLGPSPGAGGLLPTVAESPPPPLLGVTATGAPPSAALDGPSIESLLRGAAFVEAGLGVAAVGMGIYFGARARSLERQVADGKMFDAYADRDGQRASAYQYGMFTVGGALLVGSAAFFYCSHLAGRVPARITVLPAAGANGAGGALAAKF